MYSEPEASELTKHKMWRKFKWWWCGTKTGGKCEEYRRHKPQNCKGLAKTVQEREEIPDLIPSKPQQPHKRKVQFDKGKKPSKHIKLSRALAKAATADTVPADDASDTS